MNGIAQMPNNRTIPDIMLSRINTSAVLGFQSLPMRVIGRNADFDKSSAMPDSCRHKTILSDLSAHLVISPT